MNSTITFEDAHRQSDCDLPPKTLAMHPWVTASTEVATAFGVDDTLADEDVHNRAVERIITGVNTGTIAKPRGTTLATEFLSYPVARIIVSVIDDRRLTTRYVEAEADHSISVLENALWHPSEAFDAYALFDEFGIEVEETTAYDLMTEERREYAEPASWDTLRFRLPLTEYLTVATELNNDEWGLVNRGPNDGHVTIAKDEVAPFLRAAIKKRIGDPLPREVPEEIRERVEEAVETVSSTINEDLFTHEIDHVDEGLYPPVITSMLEDFPYGLSHDEKVTLAAFLLQIGMTTDEVVEALGVVGTPGEDPTRKQVEHIATNGGDGDPYMPANYDTIRSRGYEWEMDALEQKVKNPLSYYRIKLDVTRESGAFNWLDVYDEAVSPMLTYPAGPVSLEVNDEHLPAGFEVSEDGATWTCDALGDQHATGLALVAVVEGFIEAPDLSMKFLREMDSADAVDLCVLARTEYGFTGNPPLRVLTAIAETYGFEFVSGKNYLSKKGKEDARNAFDALVEQRVAEYDTNRR